MNAYEENIIESLRIEILEHLGSTLSPIAKKYAGERNDLASSVAWKPVVLILGNYSSGKSSLVNELVGMDVQATGQAPTDDSFTVITGYDQKTESKPTVDERDGKAVLSDPAFPFEPLKRHGERFSSHFRLKKIDSPILDNLAIIDTPGMLDSVSEQDRGYNYQEVISDLASLADLVLVLFDPHKAGTIRESYDSLKLTLPGATFEDRLVFVLNRVDECGSLGDLLRVYGTLCWNLSQMTGRKDIPQILLSYSSKAHAGKSFERVDASGSDKDAYLSLLSNERLKLLDLIKSTPKRRLDNMATFLETNALQLKWVLKGIKEYLRRKRNFLIYQSFWSGVVSVLVGVLCGLYSYYVNPFDLDTSYHHFLFGLSAGFGVYVFWIVILFKVLSKFKHASLVSQIENYIEPEDQMERELWKHALPKVTHFLENKKLPRPVVVAKDFKTIDLLLNKKMKEIRRALGSRIKESES